MKQQFKIFLCLCLTFFLGATSAFAQLTPSNNLGIFPPTGSFNPNGKFTSIGESGGAPGPTTAGCNFYGFRSQTSTNKAVNLGMLDVSGFTTIPSLTFNSSRFWIVDEDAQSGVGQNGFGCGRLIGFFGSASNNSVLTLYGSAIANGGTWIPSDKRLKKDVNQIGNAREMVKNLRGVSYEYLTEENPELGLSKGLQYGFITQEVEEIMPNAVRTAEAPTEGQADHQVMQYTQIIPVLTEALKEVITTQDDRLTEQLEINQIYENFLEKQIAINQAQEDLIKKMEARLIALEKSSSAILVNPALDVEVGTIDIEGVSLRQNRPNPFQGETMIEYTIPSRMNNAQLIIYDLNGKAISSSNLEAGNGQVRISANDLSSGVYFYSIENNGQTLARQKMVVK